jgi:hypothetical protein
VALPWGDVDLSQEKDLQSDTANVKLAPIINSLTSNSMKGIKGMIAAVLSIALTSGGAAQSASSFDGNWWVTMGAQDYANPNNRGLSHAFEFHFPATVAHGVFHGERGTRGEPAFYELNGPIQPDGTALLSASGITGKQEHNQGLVPPGVPYSYTVKALFKGSQGTGNSVGARVRTFHFTKK